MKTGENFYKAVAAKKRSCSFRGSDRLPPSGKTLCGKLKTFTFEGLPGYVSISETNIERKVNNS